MKTKILLLTIALSLCTINKAPAQTSGPTGDCTWTLTGTEGDYTLTISGNGEMVSYFWGLPQALPWGDSPKTM
jgi:hypothetical protein